MGCGNKIKETCGDVMYATCVDFEGNLGVNTKITESCVTLEETTEDLYIITDEVISGLDTTSLGNLCLTYPTTGGNILPKTVFEVHEEKLCELDQKFLDLNDLENLDISGWNVDFGCLEDACNNPVLTLGGFAQAVQQAICDGIIPPTQETQPRVASANAIRDDSSSLVGGGGITETSGTWTPSVVGSTSGSYTYNSGSTISTWTKQGRVVYFTTRILALTGSGSGSLQIQGLPFNGISGETFAVTVGNFMNLGTTLNNIGAQLFVTGGNTVIRFSLSPEAISNDDMGQTLTANTFTGNTNITVSGFYFTND